jgi:tRNA pseudouridine38-40 synthase
MMRNILLTISYDGTSFCGWQRQDSADAGKPVRTVQSELEKAIAEVNGKPVTLYGSGRTDSGVHAAGQAANFFSDIDSIPVENFPRAINSSLPHDIRIMSASVVDEKFNARYNATSRIYRYFITCGTSVSAVQMNYVWQVRKLPDIEKLNIMASCLKGEVDCASFAAAGDKSLSTCRYLEGAHFFTQKGFPSGDLVVFEIEANAFLWKMVRTITGTLLSLEQAGAETGSFQRVLEAKNRRKAGVTAPPQGLFLWQVKFDGVRRHR